MYGTLSVSNLTGMKGCLLFSASSTLASSPKLSQKSGPGWYFGGDGFDGGSGFGGGFCFGGCSCGLKLPEEDGTKKGRKKKKRRKEEEEEEEEEKKKKRRKNMMEKGIALDLGCCSQKL